MNERPPLTRRPISALALASYRKPRLALACVLVGAVLAGLFAFKTMTVSTGVNDLIDASVPYRQASIAFRTTFGLATENVVAVIDADSPEEADLAALRLLEGLRARQDVFRKIDAPSFDPFLVRNGLLFQDAESLERTADLLAGAQGFLTSVAENPTLQGLFDPIIEGVEATERGEIDADDLAPILNALAESARSHAQGAPVALPWSQVFSGAEPTSARRFVQATPRRIGGGLSQLKAGLKAFRAALDESAAARPAATFRATGEPLIRQAEIDAVLKGLSAAGFVSLLGVSAILAFGLRSAILSVSLGLALLAGLALTLGLGAATVGQLNLISVAFVVLFIGLSVDFGIHFGLRLVEESRAGAAPAQSVETAAYSVGGALVLSAACAAAGFLSFLPTAYRGLAELGVIAAGGMAAALLLNIVTPSAIMGLRAPKQRQISKTKVAAISVTRRLQARAGLATGVSAMLSVVAILGAAGVRIDVNPLNLAPISDAVATYESLATDARTNPYVSNHLADNLEDAAELRARLDALPEVAEARDVTVFVPVDQEAKLGVLEDIAFFAPPPVARPAPMFDDDARKAAMAALREALHDASSLGAPGYLLDAALSNLLDNGSEARAAFEHNVIAPLARLIDVASAAPTLAALSLDDVPARIRADWIAPDGRVRVEATPALDVTNSSQMEVFADAVLAVDPRASGAAVTVVEASRVVRNAFLTASLISLVLVSAILAIVLRDAVAVALALTTPMLAALWTTAVAGFLGVPFNFANVIVLPLLFGLGASASIHMVVRFRRREAGEGEGVFQTSTPLAVTLSALTTLASFGSLLLSPHRGMQSMGLLLTIAIGAILLVALVTLPSLISLADRLRAGRRRRVEGPSSGQI